MAFERGAQRRSDADAFDRAPDEGGPDGRVRRGVCDDDGDLCWDRIARLLEELEADPWLFSRFIVIRRMPDERAEVAAALEEPGQGSPERGGRADVARCFQERVGALVGARRLGLDDMA